MNLRTTINIHAGGQGSGNFGHAGRPGEQGGSSASGGMEPHASWSRDAFWKAQAYGAVVVNDQGNVLLREPKDHFDGYHWTFPKGKKDNADEHPSKVASRELLEETGFRGKMLAPIPGNFRGGTSNNNYYLVRKTGEQDLAKMDKETASVRWVSFKRAETLIGRTTNTLGRERDLAVLKTAQRAYRNARKAGL